MIQRVCWLAYVKLPRSQSLSFAPCGLNQQSIPAHSHVYVQALWICESISTFLPLFFFVASQTLIFYIHLLTENAGPTVSHIHRLCARQKEFEIQFPPLNRTLSLPAGSYPRLSRVGTVCAYGAFIIKKKKPRISPCIRNLNCEKQKKAWIFNDRQG